jgi:hypothetical protein
MHNRALARLGLPLPVCAAAVNPGFWCPFPAATTVTLDNPSYRLTVPPIGPYRLRVSLMAGKLDWLLLRTAAARARVVATGVGNADFAASDHASLRADLLLV